MRSDEKVRTIDNQLKLEEKISSANQSVLSDRGEWYEVIRECRNYLLLRMKSMIASLDGYSTVVNLP